MIAKLDTEFYKIPWYGLNSKYIAKGRAANKKVYFMISDMERFWYAIDDIAITQKKKDDLNKFIQTDNQDEFLALLDKIIKSSTNANYDIKEETGRDTKIVRISKKMEAYNFMWEFELYEYRDTQAVKNLIVQPLVKTVIVLENQNTWLTNNGQFKETDKLKLLQNTSTELTKLQPSALQLLSYGNDASSAPEKRKAEIAQILGIPEKVATPPTEIKFTYATSKISTKKPKKDKKTDDFI